MTVESRFRRSSQRLVQRYGAVRTYNHITEEVYNVETQMMQSYTQSYNIKIYKSEPKEREIKSPNLVGKEVCVMVVAAADLPVKPKVGDTINGNELDAKSAYRVEAISESWAGETVAAWKLFCTIS